MRIKKKNNLAIFLIAVPIVVIFLLLMINTLGLASKTIFPSFFSPTSSNLGIPGINTPTPNQTDASIYSTINANCCPTSTRMVISNTIDLSPNLPNNEKYKVYVAHSNGTVDIFLIGPLHSVDHPTDIFPIPPELIAQLKMQPGDKLLSTTAVMFERDLPLFPNSTPSLPIIPSTLPTSTSFSPSGTITPLPFYPYP